MKKGEKYIIEIAEVHTHYDDNGKKYPVARIKGFSALTFDQRGLDRLEKVKKTDSNLDKVCDDIKKRIEKLKSLPLNCKFVVVSTKAEYLTVGKIYEVVNGHFENDQHYDKYPLRSTLYNSSDLINYLSNEGYGGFAHYGGDTKIVVLKE